MIINLKGSNRYLSAGSSLVDPKVTQRNESPPRVSAEPCTALIKVSAPVSANASLWAVLKNFSYTPEILTYKRIRPLNVNHTVQFLKAPTAESRLQWTMKRFEFKQFVKEQLEVDFNM